MKTTIKNKKTGVVLEGMMDYWGMFTFRFIIDGTSSYNDFEVGEWDVIHNVPQVPQNLGAVVQLGTGGYVRGCNGKWADLRSDSEFCLDDEYISRVLNQYTQAKVVFEGIPQ